ncbi:MAG: hypothetical protein MK066_05270 [Crocinitomicaceae bacterium]|nr:hypothetical protein [Crocinitomicaceae bacterium]
MYRYSLLLLLLVFASCNAGRLTYVRQKQKIVTKDQIVTTTSKPQEAKTRTIHSFNEIEEKRTPTQPLPLDEMDIKKEVVNDYLNTNEFPTNKEDSISTNDDIPDEIKVNEALRSEQLAGVSLASAILAILSIPLSLIGLLISSSGALVVIILITGLLFLITGWITFGLSLRSRFTTKTARNLRGFAVFFLGILSLIILIGLLFAFL